MQTTRDDTIENLTEISNVISKVLINLKKCPKERMNEAYLEVRLELLEQNWSLYKQEYEKLKLLIPSKDRYKEDYFEKNIFDEIQENYLDIKTWIKEKFVSTKLQLPSCSNNKDEKDINKTKLPSITIPKFSGNYREWMSFKDLYMSLVHNSHLSDVEKFHYLKSSLVGEAAHLLMNFSVTENNYKKAWETLVHRFENKRCIVNELLNKFLNHRRLMFESARGVKELLDTFNEVLMSLDNMDISTSQWDPIVIHIVVSKLDSETHKLWEQHLGNMTDLPTKSMLIEFLESRFRSLEMITNINRTKDFRSVPLHTQVKSLKLDVKNRKCAYCSENHYISQCKEFWKKDVADRREFVRKTRLCFNCLVPGHSVPQCRQTKCCHVCHKKHHTMLHNNEFTPDSSAPNDSSPMEKAHTSEEITLKTETNDAQVLLATAIVNVETPTGRMMKLRALIDLGSQASFLTESACQLLGLNKTNVYGKITGIDSKPLFTKAEVNFDIQLNNNDVTKIFVKAYVLKKITSTTPTKHIDNITWKGITQNDLADPQYFKPGSVDVLLGAEVYANILQDGVIRHKRYSLIAQNTKLGWIIFGKFSQSSHPNNLVVLHTKTDIDILLKQFWEVDTITERKLTYEEKLADELYDNTHRRTQEGRYIARLPFRDEKPNIGETLPMAIKRLKQMENKLRNKPKLKDDYCKFMKDYEEQNHMEQVSCNEIDKPYSIYLPHHAVIREHALSTKLRVVFDGSASSSNGKSLNDELLIGPSLLADIRTLIMKWRQYPIVLLGDIKQMYRQILIAKEDVDYQRIVWRDEETSEIKHYRLLTLTYGTSCAPYIANKTMKQLANDEQDKYPAAAEILKHDCYMDDIMTGFYDINKAIETQKQLFQLLKDGGFELHKIASNSKDLLQQLSEENQNHSDTLFIKTEEAFKTLGILWNPKTDQFEIKMPIEPRQNYTKRKLISDIGKIYDPLGWLAPIIVIGKSFLQKVWLAGTDWDESIPDDLQKKVIEYITELSVFSLRIDRWIGITNEKEKLELHGFSDASNFAYGAVIYLRIIKGDEVFTKLIAARTKLAPVKTLTMPKLELCGAVLLAKLMEQVKNSMNLTSESVTAWCDSEIVLAWLRKNPNNLKVFVANRCTEIINIVSSEKWRYVKSTDNPADLASRGLMPSELHDSCVWFNGPEFLKETIIIYNEKSSISDTSLEMKSKAICLNVVVQEDCIVYFKKFSSLNKLVRVIAFCLRFMFNCKKRCIRKKIDLNNIANEVPFLSTDELEHSLNICLKLSQFVHLSNEIAMLKHGGQVSKSSSIRSLNAFIHTDGFLRVGGRIDNASFKFNTKHPIILSKNCNLSYLIMKHIHVNKTLHGGPLLMLNISRQNYWVISGKALAKKIVKSCVSCFKQSAKPIEQLMGDLPKERITPSRPFSKCGVDYFGPINLKRYKGRCQRFEKAYVALYICLSTKAIHLELVSDLSTPAFIASFRRFIARRGKCTEIWSDVGTNFQGAAKELNRLFSQNISNDFFTTLANEGTSWKFIPPSSPHFGGLWEAGVKAAKFHIKRVLQNSNFTYEEYVTILTQVEACLNSRPLMPISDSVNDLVPLTPGHFLIGEPTIVLADDNLLDVPLSRLDRWQLIQRKLQEFWTRWSRDYITNLQTRNKWCYKLPNVKENDVVLLKDENLPSGQWLTGRILTVHPGKDNRVRVVTVKVAGGKVLKRPISKICPLPIA